MSREIKFRAWDKKGKQMIDWPVNVYTDEDGPWWSADYIDERGSTIGSFDGKTGVLMQFTGLHDKNGVEIFEGDILKLICDCGQEEITEVYFDDGAFLVEANFGEFDLQPIGWAIYHWNNSGTEFSVIGNIYSNPELLK